MNGPAVECLLIRLEGDQVVWAQILEAIGEAARQRHRILANDHHVQPLLLERKILLDFNRNRQTVKEVHPGEAEQPVPGLVLFHR
jgi:hypothetical protein